MDSKQIADWIQVVTGVALVVGLALVGLELSQSRDVAQAQLTSEGNSLHHQAMMTLMGENPAAALAKACLDPRSLSDEELVTINAYYASLITGVARVYSIEGTTGLAEGRWMVAGETAFFLMFRTLPGRTWWEMEGEHFGPEIGSFADSMMSNAPPNEECWISDWRDRIRDAAKV